ncbi:type II toxin-antitoxin system VapC family toxin [Bradyrhizobium sp.]
MIVVDSSALIAILEEEPEAERFLTLLRDTARRIASAVTIYETGVVMGSRRGRKSEAELIALIEQLGIEIVPFAEPQIAAALEAYGRYGKGIHPKARLNLGDCVAYALAKTMNAPLLFKGNDFAATDVQLA